MNVLSSESKANYTYMLLTVQVGGAAVALECAGRELQIRVHLEEQQEEEPKEGEDEKFFFNWSRARKYELKNVK